MNIKKRLITALLSVIFCISFCFITVSADETISDTPTDSPAIIDTTPVYTEPEPATEAPATEAPTYAPITEAPTYAPATEAPTYAPVTEAPTQSVWSGNTGEDDEDDGGYKSENPNYVGGGQTYVPPVSTAPPAALYNSDENIDDNELSKSDWNDIAKNLKAAGTVDGETSDDFSFIQNNNTTGDNGNWMLVVGVLCLVLGISGIAYVIVSNVMRKKKLSKSYTNGGKRQYAYASSSSRPSSDYGDGYRQTSKKQVQRSSKYDTADVNLPKKSSSSKSNRRYK